MEDWLSSKRGCQPRYGLVVLSRTLRLLCTVAVIVSGCGPREPGEDQLRPGHLSEREEYILGQRIYNDGILPSGEPVRAFVQRDIPIDGRMATCESCHLRSGLGSRESYIVVPPTNGRLLYKRKVEWDYWGRHDALASHDPKARAVPTFLRGEVSRPAYTDETLAEVMRTGVDPSGYVLDWAMPRYDLTDRDMALLINYLKKLSGEWSPGVTAETISFATVVTENVSSEDRQAMLAVLRDIINSRNVQTRNQMGRAKRGAFFNWEKDTSYRRLELTVWELTGDRKTWQRQLEDYYRAGPVFALLGGIAEGDWSLVHEFCERNGVPCLFPATDLPVVSDRDWNTLYFSKGIYQEGEAAARYLRRDKRAERKDSVVQIVREEDSRGAVAARGFQESWRKFGHPDVKTMVLDKREPAATRQFWKDLVEKQGTAIVLFWLGREDIALLDELREIRPRPGMVFVSSTLLALELSLVPDAARDFVYVTYPNSLPQEKEKEMNVLKTWLKVRNIPATNLRVQSGMYFLGKRLTGALMHMKSEFYRDYFLEAFDMLVDQTVGIAVYPWLSFGPGQRYASKGCYIVQLTKGPDPVLLDKSGWIIR